MEKDQNNVQQRPAPYVKGRHECDILMRETDEAAESDLNWEQCEKNPGHSKFMSVLFFITNFLPKFPTAEQRKGLLARIDLTVRLRIHCTSSARPADDELSEHRGTDRLRLGTGFVCSINGPECNGPCPCADCGGETKTKHWIFLVRTANHVVFNTEEAQWTKVDLFYDRESDHTDNTMKTVWGLDLDWAADSDRDICRMMCVTHDEALAERIKSAFDTWRRCKMYPETLSDLNFLPTCSGDFEPALIISHPHEQPKKISVGELREKKTPVIKYSTATCRGSSGAPVFVLDPNQKKFRSLRFIIPVHCGRYTETHTQNPDGQSDVENDESGEAAANDQLNYGYHRHIT